MNKVYQRHVKITPVSYMIYLIVMGSVSALLFFIMSGCQLFGDRSLYLFSFFACLSVIINMLVSLLSLSYAPLASVTVSQNAGTLVLPILYGVLILNESINTYNIIGICFIIIAFLISFVGDYRINKMHSRNLFGNCICIILFFTSGVGNIIHKSFTISGSIANIQTYLSWINIYMVSIIVVAFAIYRKIKKSEFHSYIHNLDKSRYLLVVFGSTIGCLGMYFSMKAMMNMNISLYSALYSSMYIIILIIVSKYYFKADLIIHHYLSVMFAVISVIFTSMA